MTPSITQVPSPAMKPLRPEWKPGYDSGDPRIDREHRGLVAHLVAIADAQESNSDFDTIYTLLSRLVRDTIDHFASEESVLIECGYPDLECHAGTHSRLAEKMTRLLSTHARSDLLALEALAALFYDAVVIHMVSDDRQYYPFLRTRQ